MSALFTAKQTECSEEAWEIMMTLMLLSRITLRGTVRGAVRWGRVSRRTRE